MPTDNDSFQLNQNYSPRGFLITLASGWTEGSAI